LGGFDCLLVARFTGTTSKTAKRQEGASHKGRPPSASCECARDAGQAPYSFSYGFPTAAGATALPMKPARTMMTSTYGSMR
jgi:hypothetical protein